MNTLVCSAISFRFTALCYSSGYFPTAANEPEVSHIHRKPLTYTLNNKVEKLTFVKKKTQDDHRPSEESVNGLCTFYMFIFLWSHLSYEPGKPT